MRTPLQRIRRGAAVLAIVFLVAVASFHAAGFPWLEAIWFFFITVAGVGYNERSTQEPLIQFLTVGLILFGMSAAAYTFGGFLEMVVEGEMDRLLGHRRTSREIDKLNGHVILCGFGRIGQILAAELERNKLSFVVIENEPQHATEARAREFLLIEADATDDEVLLRAGITRAKTLVTGVPNDAANVFITLTGRNLNPDIHIVARAEHATSERKLLQAGANKVVMPAATGARQMARMITRPSTADLMALVSDSGNYDIELDEFLVTDTSRLGGTTVRDSEAHRKYRLLVVAVKQTSGNMVFNPEADFRFQIGDIVILMGRAADIRHFRAEHHT